MEFDFEILERIEKIEDIENKEIKETKNRLAFLQKGNKVLSEWKNFLARELTTEIIISLKDTEKQQNIIKEDMVKTKNKLNYLQQVSKLWIELKKLNNLPISIVISLKKKKLLLKKMENANDKYFNEIDKIHKEAMELTRKIMLNYPLLIDKECKEAGYVLDQESRHPKYSLKNGFFKIEINNKSLMATLYDYEGKLAKFPADIQNVVNYIKIEHKRIFDKKFDGIKFLQLLRNQYIEIIKNENRIDGDAIPIRNIPLFDKKNKKFRSDESIVYLSHLVKKGPYEIENRQLDLQQTKDTDKGILLFGAASRGYIGFILFKEVKQ